MSIGVFTNQLMKPNSDVYTNNKPFIPALNESINEIQNQPNNELAYTVSNVVCSYSTRCHLNLRKIAMEGMHVEYRKENGMVNMKIRSPYTTASIWSSGKITCTGSKSEADAYKAARRYCRVLQKLGFKVKLCNFRVVNVLATSSMSSNLDIIKLANDYPKDCSYEPEIHCGATFTFSDIKATLKIYTTGSITLTAPSVNVVATAINKISIILNNYRIEKSPPANNLDLSHIQAKSFETATSRTNNIKINTAYANSIVTNNINLSINKNQLTLLQPSNFMPQTIAFTNNSNGCNIIHANNNTRHKSFFIDEIDEEFLP